MGNGQPPTPEQQAAIKAAQDAQNLRVFEEQQASIAKAEKEKADNQKFYDENLSPEAQKRDKEAAERNEKEDAAILGAVGTAIEFTEGYAGGRGGVSPLGVMTGPLGGGLFAALLGGFGAPTQDAGPTSPAQTRQYNNTFSV